MQQAERYQPSGGQQYGGRGNADQAWQQQNSREWHGNSGYGPSSQQQQNSNYDKGSKGKGKGGGKSKGGVKGSGGNGNAGGGGNSNRAAKPKKVEEKIEKYFWYLARCVENFVYRP